MNWEKRIVRTVLEAAGENSNVQLQFLLERLEDCPDGLQAIIEATKDMANWSQEQANAFSAEKARRQAQARLDEIVKAQK